MTTEAFTNDPKIQKMTGDYQVDTKELSTILEKEDNVKNILDVLKTKESDVRSIRGLENAVLLNLNKLANKNNISELSISEKGLLKLYMGLYRNEKLDNISEQQLLDKFVLSQKVKVNQLPADVHLSNEISIDATGIYTMHIGKAKNELFDEGVNGYNTKIQFIKDEKGVRSLYKQTENSTYTLYDVNSKSSIIEKRILALPSNDKNKSSLNYYTLSNDTKNPFEVSLVSYTKAIPIKADNLNTGEFEKTIISERTTVGGKEAFFSMVLKSNDKTTNSSSEYNTKEKDQKIYFDKEGKLIPNQTLFLKQKGKSIFMTYVPEQALDGSISFKIDEKQARSEYKDLKKTAVNYTTQVKESGDKDVYNNELRQVKEGFKDNKLEVEQKIDVSGTIPLKVLNVNQDRLQIGAISGGKFVDDLTVPFSEFVTTTKDEKGNESEKKKDLIVICVDQKLYNIRKKSDTKYEISDFKDPNIDRISSTITNSFNNKYRNGLAQNIDIAANLIAIGPSEDIISQTDGSDMIQYTLQLQANDSAKSKVDIVFDNKGRLVSSKEKTDKPTQYASIILNGERLFLTLTQEKDSAKVSVTDKDVESMTNYLQHMTFEGLDKYFSQLTKLPDLDTDGKYKINGITFNKLLEIEDNIQTIDGKVYKISGSNGTYKAEKTTEQQQRDIDTKKKETVTEKLKKQLPSDWTMTENTQGYWMKSTDGLSGIQVDKSGVLNGLTEVKKWDTRTNTFVIDIDNKAVLDSAGKLQITKKADAEKILNTVNESKERLTKAQNIVLPTGWEKVISSAEDGNVSIKLYSPEDLQKYFAEKAGLEEKIKQLNDYTIKSKEYADYSATEKDTNNNSQKGCEYEEFKTTQLKDHGEFNDNDKKLRQDKCAAKKRELLGTMTDVDAKKIQNDIDTAIVAYRKANPTELPSQISLDLCLEKTEHTIGSGKLAKKSVREDITYDSKNTHKLSFEYSTDKQAIITKQNNQEVGKGLPVSNNTVNRISIIQLEKKPEIVNKNGRETIVNTPTIKATSDAKDITPTWKKNADGNFVNPIRTSDGKEIQVIVNKNNGTITTDKPNEYTVQQNADKTVSVTKKSTENSPINQNNTSPIFPEKKVNTSESKESHENLPNFTWAKYKPLSSPAPMTLKYENKDYDTTFKDKEVYNNDFSSQFNVLVKLVNTLDSNYSEEQKKIVTSFQEKLKVVNDKSTGEKVKAIQAWSAEKGGVQSKDFDIYKLSDGNVGINTYSALLLALYTSPGFANNQDIKKQYDTIKGNFTEKTQTAIADANNKAQSENNFA